MIQAGGRIAVIGAGAAGVMAAIHAAEAGARVILVERTGDGGRKIVMSGGGRCNALPSELDPGRFVTESSPNTMRNLLLAWPLAEQRRYFETVVGIPLALELETGKLFPVSNRSRDVRDGLVALAGRMGVETRFGAKVDDVVPDGRGAWSVSIQGGGRLEASSVILATGGLSVPATGSDGTGLDVARRLGHVVNDTYPALTPLIAQPHRYAALTGISLRVTVEAPAPKRRGTVARGGFLFTHKGYSGPAVLNVSHHCVRARRRGQVQPIRVQWIEEEPAAVDGALRGGGNGDRTVLSLLRERLPVRLAEALLEDAGVAATAPLAQLRREERNRLVQALTATDLPWTGDEGYTKAEVTGGGVALSEVDPRTLESRRHPGLFLCGEMLDAFGPIGGYNFTWAWSTGRTAGWGAARRQLKTS